MKFYLAPMEGITGYIYRNAYAASWGGVDKYFTPFIAANQAGKFSTREWEDVNPEHNKGLTVIPQILTNKAEDFILTASHLKDLGYNEINLNLGCPSGTVVSKGRGSGFLAFPDALQSFLEEIFSKTNMNISIKTRLGKEDPQEFYNLLSIYEQYPLEELIIHPRVQKDYYKNTPHMLFFTEAVQSCRHSICYNGDLFTVRQYESFKAQYPSVEKVMFGRGIIANPGLISEIKSGKGLDQKQLKIFHDQLFEGYQQIMSGEKNVLFKMKELWFYLSYMFPGSEKYMKKIKKAQHFKDYVPAVSHLFEEQTIDQNAGLFSWQPQK